MNDEPKSLLSHIIALRSVLINSFFAIVIVMAVCFQFVDQILDFILTPLAIALKNGGFVKNYIYTSISEMFSLHLRISFYSSVFLCFPYIAYQIWSFLKPALTEKEFKIASKIFVLSPVMFLIGVCLAFYFVIPNIISALINEAKQTAEFLPKLSENVSFIMRFLLLFGLGFEMPLVILFLDRLNILKIQTIKKLWREVVILIVTVSAIITPPDAFSMISLMVPLILLYVLSIVFCKTTK